eukprot:TRINITY_DN45993_c0_g1_i1.p1 TRINITY_DN45993_c0_g1~~TRINITY_DN45993_c0_g1_i1.p1  ORF type:complete len:604 (+),score=161.00 TRINITY_DN45993_c0_g1_i1:189-2000(+)
MPPKQGKTAVSNAHEPKTKIDTRHKVILFGTLVDGDREEYKFLHQRVDLKVTRGEIPVGFLSSMVLEEGTEMYLETREGGEDEEGEAIGPEYRVSWRKDREVIGAVPKYPEGWRPNLDELWTAVLSYLESKNLVSEDTLQYLDADPFVLFGIDDVITQQALLKLKDTPALLCTEASPKFEEWANYIRIDPDDKAMKWLVTAFSETELPAPWTCYKGVGSIVCYINSTTGMVQWMHPFYHYFKQLRDYCRQASQEEVMQVRVNRLLWSYEATRVETEHDMEPLICPEYIQRMGDIFGYDVREQGFLVRNLKAQLRVFAKSFRKTQAIDLVDIGKCVEILQRDIGKAEEMQEHWKNKMNETFEFELSSLSNGEILCVNCQATALCFCLECKDYLCISCYDLLHNKGARLAHSPFRLVPCSLCVDQPAKLHCTFTDRSLCHECYALRHIKMLPADGKENQPRRIDYLEQYGRYAQFASDRLTNEENKEKGIGTEDGQPENYSSVLSTDWHPFYDSRGVKYYHNFATRERMRQSPRRVPNTEDPGVAEAHAAHALKVTADQSTAIPLEGFDSLRTETSAAKEAAENPELRSLKAPFRRHQPMEVSAG